MVVFTKIPKTKIIIREIAIPEFIISLPEKYKRIKITIWRIMDEF